MTSELFVTIDHQFKVSQIDSQTFIVDGKTYSVDFSRREGKSYSLILNGLVFGIEYLEQGTSNSMETLEQILHVSVSGKEYTVTVEDHKSMLVKSLAQKKSTKEGAYTVHSPMPGLVVKLEVREGEEVFPGQGLVVLEAMKMENELKAQQKGRIKALHVQQGQAVQKGEKLITISNA